jgi:hypothetical protein
MGLAYLLKEWVTRSKFRTKHPRKSAAIAQISVVTANWRFALCVPLILALRSFCTPDTAASLFVHP